MATDDLSAALAALARGRAKATHGIETSLEAARQPACAHAFVRLCGDEAREAARDADAARAAGRPLRLGGLAVSVKDLYDVRGAPTTAASKVLADAAPAERDCTAVARLRSAGAALIGRTNMTEFAFSGLGLNPHHGTPANPVTAALDPGTARIPGGSTSGGVVSVAAGAAWAALGSDTGGSVRIPAALCGLVGFKNTQALTPTDGTIPLSPSLDTTCAITRSVRDAVLLHEVLAARTVALAGRPVGRLRFARPRDVFLDGLDPTVAHAFERSVERLRAAGAEVVDTTIDGLQDASVPQALAGIVAAEAWAWHRERITARGGDYDPRVASRIRRGEALTAADVQQLRTLREAWQAQVARSILGFDAVLVPTVPVVAPPLQPLVASDERYTAANLLMLRNPSIVNQLDGCAISLPCHDAGHELPVGLMLFLPAHRDDDLLDAALAVESTLASGNRP